MGDKQRCSWCNIKNPLYIDYHDNEWCVPNFDEKYLYEMLILESFQAGLSWECVLNKRESFRKAYDNFDIEKVVNYTEEKTEELLCNKEIIRNKLKIKASISNSKIFKKYHGNTARFITIFCLFTMGKSYTKQTERQTICQTASRVIS